MSRMSHADLQRRVAAMRSPWAVWFEGKEFTTDWTSAHFGSWSQVLAPFQRDGLRLLEIGSFEGRSAIFWLEYFPGSHVTCVDKFFGTTRHNQDIEARFDRNVAAYGERVRKINRCSAEVLPSLRIEDELFDLIYIDGSHRRDDVMADCLLSWPLLRPGGVMIFDDYLHELHKPPAERPKDAIDTFLSWHAEEVDELSRGYQIIVRRRPLSPGDVA
jgi:predicted O-methyltransferase YrrM